MRRTSPLVLLHLLICLSSEATAQELSSEQTEFFEERIRPVLVEHCYECHNSSGTAEGGLILDHRSALMAGADSGPVINAAAKTNRLIQVMRHEIDGLEMPEGGAKLEEATIQDFEKWIEMGVPDPREKPPPAAELESATSWEAIREKRKGWWSFRPITRPPLPPLPDDGWSELPIDRFISRRLREADLRPALEADRGALVRRVYFALIGLPPSPEQVDEFLTSESPKAYEQLVETLLESPHFGERWARHWMDWIRYAESHGSEGDPRIFGASHYRDYLIRGLIKDVPYDQLVAEHIAGDLLPDPRINDEQGINESLIGTAHWRMVFHGFAPTDALDEKVRFTDDSINAFSKAFQGLTVSCARCHNHKFDAISQADYYALFGILGSTRPGRSAMQTEQKLTVCDDELRQLKFQIRDAISEDWLKLLEGPASSAGTSASSSESLPQFLRKALGLADEKLPERVFTGAWMRCVERFSQYEQELAAYSSAKHSQVWDLSSAVDYAQWFTYGTGLSEQPSEPGVFSVAAEGERVLRGVYPAGVYSHLVSDKHGARLSSKDFQVVGNQRLWLQVRGDGKAMSRYVVQDYPRNGTVYPVTEYKSDSDWKWQAYDLDYWSGDAVHVELTTANDAPLLVKNSDRSWFGVRRVALLDAGEAQPPKESLEHLKALVAAAQSVPPRSIDELQLVFRQVVKAAVEAWKSDTISDDQAVLIDRCLAEGWLPNSLAELPKARPLIEEYRRIEAGIPVATRIPTLAEWRGADQRLYERGNHKQPRDEIPRRFLEAIDPTPYETALSGRLQLANDLLRTDNPFTARVIVNRIWHHLFGQGIVATPDNFGRLGEEPTHPELLDYLADEFRTEDRWSIKSLIRKIVLSQTWRQASHATDRAQMLDPDNRLYSHFSLRRLDAEAIRDELLFASGQLDRTMFGPSVNGNSNRRSIYVEVIRNRLDPFLTAFDAPIPFSAKGRRDVTNVPAQSLLMLNNLRIRALAEQFAAAALRESDDERERINMLWMRALGRPANPQEQQAAARLLSEMDAEYSLRRERVSQLTKEIAATQASIQSMLGAAKDRLSLAHRDTQFDIATLRPLADWRFDSLEDAVGDRDLELMESARLEEGALVLDGKGWAQTKPLATALQGKTLEVFLQLESLDQKGGGAMTVQNLSGTVFDAVVFGERRPREWLAGSNNFLRTRDFGGGPENEAKSSSTHVMIVYGPEGSVSCYRNGEAYGQAYETKPQSFSAADSVILFGMRHGTAASGNRMLKGRILEARLYARALSADEVRQAARYCSGAITREDVLATLSESQRNQLAELEQLLETQQRGLEGLHSALSVNEHWTDLAHSIFNLKEFIYVR